MDIRQSGEYQVFLRKQGWLIEKIGGGVGGKEIVAVIKRPFLIPFGVMKCQRFLGYPDVREVERVKKERKVVYSIWEPGDEAGVRFCKEKGMREAKAGYLPSVTRVIELRKSTPELWKGLSKDARKQVGKAAGVVIWRAKKRGDWNRAWVEWKKSGKGYVPNHRAFDDLFGSFGEKGWVMMAKMGAEIVAGMVVLVTDERAYYYYAWTNKKGRKIGAQYKLVWEGMIKAKRAGLKEWDFEGVEDLRRQNRSWRGFSLFKRKFGGREVRWPVSFRQWF